MKRKREGKRKNTEDGQVEDENKKHLPKVASGEELSREEQQLKRNQESL